MKNNTKIVIGLLISIYIAIPSYALPEYVSGSFCGSGCHNKVSMEDYSNDPECGSCHNYVISRGKFDFQKMQQTHDSKVCKLCHSVQTSLEYHTIHRNGTCDTCHINGQRPEVNKSDCRSCHANADSTIHEIHAPLNMCPTCHGTAVASKPKPDITTAIIGEIQKVITINETKTVELRKFTIFEFLKRIFG